MPTDATNNHVQDDPTTRGRISVADNPLATPENPHGLVPAVVDAAGAAAFCGIKRSAWYKLRTQGRVPMPITLGRRVVWVIAELHAWLCAGAPPSDRWTLMRDQAMGSNKHGR